MPAVTMRQALLRERPLRLPIAHDAMTARLVERAGFHAYSIGGFALVGARYALPDVGVTSFGEMVAGVRDIMMGSTLPVLVDADDGYGDQKNVTRTVQSYEAMGVAAIFIEDQVAPKRCGHLAGKRVIAPAEMRRKLDAALAARRNSEFLIIARTDARAVHGLDDALDRAEAYIAAGVDGVFVEAPTSVAELELIGREFGAKTLLLANMAAGGRTPLVSAAELARMGYAFIGYPATVLVHVVAAIQAGLAAIRQDDLSAPPTTASLAELTRLFGIEAWDAVDDRFGAES